MKSAVFWIAMLIGPTVRAASDPCVVQIPALLQSRLEGAFPKFRIPVTTDNLAEDVQYNREQGGTGCLGIASADFDGDGKQDLLLALTARVGSGGLVVVALSRGTRWMFSTLSEWSEGRNWLFVEAEKPGKYDRTEALEGPLEPGEKASFTCTNAVAVYGKTESSAVAFCFSHGKWSHVWISD